MKTAILFDTSAAISSIVSSKEAWAEMSQWWGAASIYLVAPAVAGRVDKPGDVVHPDSAHGASPDHSRQAANCEQGSKHGHHMPRVCALDELVEGLHVQVACVSSCTYALQGGLQT